MTGFTKGPWKTEFGCVVTEYKPDTKRIHGYGADNDFVCDLNDGDYHEYYSSDEQEANANLIAAAPDLYEASDPFENIAEEEDTADLREDTPVTVIIGERVHDFTLKMGDLRAIQKALRKARGET